MAAVCRACGGPTPGSRRWYCDVCRPRRVQQRERLRELRRDRATPTERGYGTAHYRLRKEVARLVEAGGAVCARCLRPIVPGEPWDLGHDDLDRSRYSGPEHRRCNRATAGRKSFVGVLREW